VHTAHWSLRCRCLMPVAARSLRMRNSAAAQSALHQRQHQFCRMRAGHAQESDSSSELLIWHRICYQRGACNTCARFTLLGSTLLHIDWHISLRVYTKQKRPARHCTKQHVSYTFDSTSALNVSSQLGLMSGGANNRLWQRCYACLLFYCLAAHD
jgi:hypothetical protein